MRQHSMACEFPEGCSCGASELNAMETEIKRLRYALGVIVRNVDAGAVHVSWCSDYAKSILSDITDQAQHQPSPEGRTSRHTSGH